MICSRSSFCLLRREHVLLNIARYLPKCTGSRVWSFKNRAEDEMTMRDAFAIAAITGILAHSSETWVEDVENAFKVADMMLKARIKDVG
jgi:hypothetical protein